MNHNPFSLAGKTILVTGASSGIGRATAIECSKMGATVVITGRNEDRLNETFGALEDSSLGHRQIMADLSNQEDLSNLVGQLPLLDGCVSNAGIGKDSPVQFYTQDDVLEVYDTNVFAPMMLIKSLVKKKKLAKPSSVVFTASIGGVFSITNGGGIYGTSKAAIDCYMKFAALELAGKGIRCNSVNPGMVHTPLIGKYTQEEYEADLKNYPLKRYGEPKDIAYAIIYLLSDASSWVTGTELKIDGGRTLK